MGHKVVIINAYATMFASPEVREKLSTAQCACVDEILQSPDPSNEDIGTLSHFAVRVYKKPDV